MGVALVLLAVAAAAEDTDEDERLRRLAITAAGGAAGLVLPLAVTGGIAALENRNLDNWMTVAVAALPFTFATGIGVSNHLAGGRAGVGFGMAGALAGYMTSSALLALVFSLGRTDWGTSAPVPGAAIVSAFGLIGAITAMELRHTELAAGATPWRLGRALAQGAVFWVGATALESAFVLIAIALGNATRSNDATLVTVGVGSVATVFAASAAAWGLHRAMDGHGRLWPALVGVVASASIAAAFVALHAHAPPAKGLFGGGAAGIRSLTIAPVAVIAAMITFVGPAVALEWSSALNTEPEGVVPPPEEPLLPVDLQLGASLGPNGGSIGLNGTF